MKRDLTPNEVFGDFIKELTGESETMELDATFVADENVEELLIEIEELKVQIKLLEEQKKHAEKLLVETVKESTQTIIDHTGHCLATWALFYRDYFDQKKFHADYPNLYDAYVEKRPQRRLDIKRRKMS